VIALALVGLAAMWIAVLVPEWWRERSHGDSRGGSIQAFQRQLSVLGRATPQAVEPAHRLGDSAAPVGSVMRPYTTLASGRIALRGLPSSADQASQRRRAVLASLIGAAVITMLLWMITGSGLVLALHLLADGLVVAFTVLLLRHRQIRMERASKVRHLHMIPQATVRRLEPALVRSAR
jgi:hypothetical protein